MGAQINELKRALDSMHKRQITWIGLSEMVESMSSIAQNDLNTMSQRLIWERCEYSTNFTFIKGEFHPGSDMAYSHYYINNILLT